MDNYKEHIEQTRIGNVGSSDSKTLQQIAELGLVPKSALKRLAVVKGLCENGNITTPAMRFGDYIEQMVYDHLHTTNPQWQSNPCLTSEKYSRKNVNCITHIDFLLQDDANKTLVIGECKATKLSFEQARNEYKYQLCHHWLLGLELAKKLGGYKVKLLLCVYDANDVDYDNHEFDPQRLTVKYLRGMDKVAKSYRLSEAMDLVDSFLEGFNEYYGDGEEIPSEYLPTQVQQEFVTITNILAEIKEKEAKVDEFKKRLTSFMEAKGIKSIKSDEWAITYVAPSEAVTTDFKAIFEQEFEAKKPRTAKRLKDKYKKVTKRNAYCTIKIRNNNNNV